MNAGSSRNIRRTRKIVNHRIDKRLNTLIMARTTHNKRNKCTVYSTFSDCSLKLLNRNFLSIKIKFGKFIITGCNLINKFFAPGYCICHTAFVDVAFNNRFSLVIGIPAQFFHAQKVNHPLERLSFTDRNLKCKTFNAEFFLNVFHRTEKVCADSIHFIHKTKARNFKFVCLLPDSFRLRLNAVNRADNGNRAVKDTEGTLDFRSKINVPRCVDYIYLIVFPIGSRSSTANRNSAFLLLRHPVHSCLTVINLAYLMYFFCIIQNPLCRRCFSGINMSHNSDVPHFFK